MSRIKGFALALGVAMLIVAGLACGAEEKQDPTDTGPPSNDLQARGRSAPSGSAGQNTPNLTIGSPQPPVLSGSPMPSLKFDEVDYVHGGSTELALGEGLVFAIQGIETSVDDLESVGNTSEGNTPGIQDGLMVYQLKGSGTNDVYTFRPGEDHLNPEDGKIFKGQDVWTRWTTQ